MLEHKKVVMGFLKKSLCSFTHKSINQFTKANRFPLITKFFPFHKIMKHFKEICSAYK